MAAAPDDDPVWMQHAVAEARQAAQLDEVPVGAVVVLDGAVIGQGHNRTRTDHDPTGHAEIVALRDAAQRLGNYRLAGATLYSTIEPCSMCAGALVHARIARLVFGADEPKAGAVVSSACVLDNASLNHRVEVTRGVLATECAALMSDFFREKRL